MDPVHGVAASTFALVALYTGLACASTDSPVPATAPSPAPTDAPEAPPSPAPREPVDAPVIERTSDGVCTPMPKRGDPCRPSDAWCIESWGEPGGHSSALWCRDGRWEREQEVNLE